LVILFALRYSNDHKVNELKRELEQADIKNLQIIDMVVKYAGDSCRKLRVSEGGVMGKITKVFNQAFKEIPNVFTQHKSLMYNILDSAAKGKLKDLDFPSTNADIANEGIEDIIVFIVGGATYQEAKEVHEFKKEHPNVLLGGTSMMNSKTFLADIVNFYTMSNAGGIRKEDLKSF